MDKSGKKKDLKGKDFKQSLTTKLWEEIEIEPFYTKEDLAHLPEIPKNCFEKASDFSGFPSRNWVNFSAVYPKTSNKEVLNALENGASGLILYLDGNEKLDHLLKGVQAEYISILVKPLGDPLLAMKSFLTWTESTGINEMEINGGMLWSPMDLLFSGEKSLDQAIQILKAVIASSPKSKNFHSFQFNFSRYAEAGASGLDELIFGFGEIIELIDQSGIEPKVIFEKSGIFTAVGDLHFPEIAKLKAIRFFLLPSLLFNMELTEVLGIVLFSPRHPIGPNPLWTRIPISSAKPMRQWRR